MCHSPPLNGVEMSSGSLVAHAIMCNAFGFLNGHYQPPYYYSLPIFFIISLSHRYLICTDPRRVPGSYTTITTSTTFNHASRGHLTALVSLRYALTRRLNGLRIGPDRMDSITPLCATWVNSSISCTRELMEAGHFKSLEQHMQGKRCKPSNNNSPSSLSRAPSFSSLPPSAHSPPAFSPASSTASLPPLSPTFTSPYLPSWSSAMDSPSLQFIEESPTNQQRVPILFRAAAIAAPPSRYNGHRPPRLRWRMLNLEWPQELSFRMTFPFHRLTLRGDEGDLPFEIEIHDRGKVITVWSKRCKRSTTEYSPHCHECDALRGRLEELAQIARDARKGNELQVLEP
ncbi:hypothetical protein B0H14DRAFT_2556730 [Mycena olivaceomarginata]|nr:hypothetical protein B0H14DRAFT_2556730 [Mycena olivaceomarginata]